ncbi:hypothetical protein WOC76_11585 [Methylocystis sp. IM3]|jgi:hypothetical protein|uniref:hypothetical protein n=1 Tax=unclassified Methylocystis TaxID=2625913 RepID=UPI000FB1955F|nr:MAG: hypothetical protein EKK29_19140 [Hyphomicrobiales bacterium]
MSDNHPVESNEPQAGGHPHDLLARLYREIGISAVAAALEAAQFSDLTDDAPQEDGAWSPLGGEIAA